MYPHPPTSGHPQVPYGGPAAAGGTLPPGRNPLTGRKWPSEHPYRGRRGGGVWVPGVHVPVIYIGHPHTGIPLGMWSDTVSPPLGPHPLYWMSPSRYSLAPPGQSVSRSFDTILPYRGYPPRGRGYVYRNTLIGYTDRTGMIPLYPDTHAPPSPPYYRSGSRSSLSV